MKRSRFHGIYWDEERGKWRGIIRLDGGKGKVVQLGRYNTEEEAVAVREAYIDLQKVTGVLRNVHR